MNSLEKIKQELINQKTLLEQKGFPVATQNAHPSPSEITSAIDNIEADFTLANAKEDDVVLGKTFFAETGKLKTGTLDVDQTKYMSDYGYALLTGEGKLEITFPANVTKFRDYAFYSQGIDCYYSNGMIVPEHISYLGYHTFSHCKGITGKVVIPSTCSIDSYCFYSCSGIEELELYGHFAPSSSYHFGACASLKKLTLGPNTTRLPTYLMYQCTSLTELDVPETVTFVDNYVIRRSGIVYINFLGENPPTIGTLSFTNTPKPYFVVPYQHYMNYYNATNYASFPLGLFAFAEFTEGEELPTMLEEGVTPTWYATREDLIAQQNSYTICPATGKMYALMQVPTTEETTE